MDEKINRYTHLYNFTLGLRDPLELRAATAFNTGRELWKEDITARASRHEMDKINWWRGDHRNNCRSVYIFIWRIKEAHGWS